jgi:ankyrin repeat protein
MDEQLIAAIEAKNLPLVEDLLAAGANPNAQKGDKTAYQLVPHGADEIKCALIESGFDDPQLRNALVWVIMTGRVNAVRVLLDRGSDVNVSTYCGTPIQVAASRGYTEIVELLIEAGADVDAGSGISTPLLEALEHGHTDIALKLIGAGADPNRTAHFGATTPIAMASAQGYSEVIKTLIAAGANVNAEIQQITLNRLQIQREVSSNLSSAFDAMERFGQIMESLQDIDENEEVPSQKMVEIQSEIAQIESVSSQPRIRSTQPENAVDTFPIIITARCGHAEALTTLLEAGANPHRKDGEGMSAYDWAIRNEYPNILEVLRQFGITETRIDQHEKLLLAAENGDVLVVRDCLERGANPNTRDVRRQTRDKTPLILASKLGHSTIVRVLLEAGADPDLTDRGEEAKPVSKSLLEHTDPETILSMGYSFGRTALMVAAEVGYAEIVQLLLRTGSNPNLQDAVDYTALALATENSHLSTVRALIAAGAEVDREVTYGNTPLILSCEKSAVEVAEFLLMQGADPFKTNRDRETALMKASAAGSLPLVQILIQREVNINAISKNRQTAIALAAGASQYVEVDKNSRNLNNNIREHRGDGSIWEWQSLPESRIIEIVQTLLQAGADPNISNCENTPLIEAARNGHLQLLQLLLNSGALLDVYASDGDTAVSIAKLYKRQNILEFLREYTGTDLSEFESIEPEEDENSEEDDERWGEELAQPDFSESAQNPNYLKAVNELAEICGSQPIGSENCPGWFSIHVNSKHRKNIKTEELQQQFLEKGCFVYEPDSYYGDGPEKLCILPTTDKYQVIALHQTNGCNYGIGPGYVVRWLQDIEAKQPFTLTCIAHDTLAGRFLTSIEDPENLSELMYDFCPDIVEQGCGSVEILAENLASSDNLFFWWD